MGGRGRRGCEVEGVRLSGIGYTSGCVVTGNVMVLRRNKLIFYFLFSGWTAFLRGTREAVSPFYRFLICFFGFSRLAYYVLVFFQSRTYRVSFVVRFLVLFHLLTIEKFVSLKRTKGS